MQRFGSLYSWKKNKKGKFSSSAKEAWSFLKNAAKVNEMVMVFAEEFYEGKDLSGKVTLGTDIGDAIREQASLAQAKDMLDKPPTAGAIGISKDKN